MEKNRVSSDTVSHICIFFFTYRNVYVNRIEKYLSCVCYFIVISVILISQLPFILTIIAI